MQLGRANQCTQGRQQSPSSVCLLNSRISQPRLPSFPASFNPHLPHTNNLAGQRYWLLMCRHSWGCRYRCLGCKAANCLSARPAAGRYVTGGDGVWVGVGVVVVAWHGARKGNSQEVHV